LHVERNVETHVEPNVDLVFKTFVKPCVDFVSQVHIVSNKVVERSSTLDISVVFLDDVVNDPPTKETCLVSEISTYQINPPIESTKETPYDDVVEPDVGPSHVQLDIIVEPSFVNVVDVFVLSNNHKIELAENQNVKNTEANKGVSTEIVNTMEGCLVMLLRGSRRERKVVEKPHKFCRIPKEEGSLVILSQMLRKVSWTSCSLVEEKLVGRGSM